MSTPGVPGSFKRPIILIVVLVLLPVLFFSAYQIGTYSSSETMMRDLYGRQMDVLLASVNQHAWDITAHWAATLQQYTMEAGKPLEERVNGFLARTPVVEAVILVDSTGRNLQLTSRPGSGLSSPLRDSLRAQLWQQNEALNQLARYRSLEYLKLEPLVLRSATPAEQRIALVFANDPSLPLPRFGGMIFREDEFITRMLAERIDAASGEEYTIAVFRKGQDSAVVRSGPIAAGNIVQRRSLWTFPDHEIVIASRGTTIDQVVHGRLIRNTILVIIVNLLLLGGLILVYRTVRAEVDLARAKSSFVSNVSHELRTPLALIRMYAETLDMGRLKDEAKKQEYYRTILRETERLTHLVNNLLNFSRMEAGRKPYQLAPCSLPDIVRNVLSTYGLQMESAGFVPVVELPGDDIVIPLDKEAAAEALINLLDNAVKYSTAEKYLRVGVRRLAHEVAVEVEDHGIGIPAQYHVKIFEAFFRVPSGFVHDTKGSGLGLSLVQHIMEAHGGRIELESVPDKGTLVRLLFPLAAA
jgi:two-component system, OmpR family, phosphate regulon sensor histidine kinase PhoR